jgi:NADH pyrophosphatase NudC (nudix superfamily)
MTDMSKELKALKLAHAVEKQIMQDNFTQCKTAAEYLKTENNNLRCCGNCGKHYKDCQNELSYGYCPRWTTDGMTRGERQK